MDISIIKKEYHICDKCKEKIKERWYRRMDLRIFKKRLIVEGHVLERDYDLCGMYTEKFERFMDGVLDDDKPTEYEQYYQQK